MSHAPDEECLECGHDYGYHDERSRVCCVSGCLCDRYADPGGQETPTFTPERTVQFTDQDDLGRGILGYGLR